MIDEIYENDVPYQSGNTDDSVYTNKSVFDFFDIYVPINMDDEMDEKYVNSILEDASKTKKADLPFDYLLANIYQKMVLKFGKSEGNAVWLDANKTSPYGMYQFWLNVMDEDAIRFLKIFTFLSLDDIEAIRRQFEEAPHQRLAQKTLAKEVVTLVHGQEAYQEALKITEQLFAGNIQNLSADELKQGLSNVPNYAVTASDSLNIVDLLVTSGVVTSKRQAREDIQNGAIYINGHRIQELDYELSAADKIGNELTLPGDSRISSFAHMIFSL